MSGLSRMYDEAVAHDGLVETTLGQLREELGYTRLGRGVLEGIVVALGKHELGYFPREVLDPRCNTEPRQWNKVWVYVRDNSTRARVLDAVLCPEQANVRSVLDGLVSRNPSALTTEEKLQRIREIANS
ncbi:hypothetical protein [Streptomyces coffeae]|uniref:Uncharacterized protein n=1 Tax=Streptomyces coffeae TaxID=621382 RepID=A0ABS1NLB3_9ACTN|nr:hypothetical protein [Streptomyces coffeae]MBL1100868.1 hypothetical protein [Streptomyces coffeae]